MHIVSGVAGAILIGIAVYKIAMAAKGGKQQTTEGTVIWGLVGEKTSQNGPITIKRIVGPRGNGEPILTNRAPGEDKSQPWTTHRGDDGAEPFFDYQWKERTEDDPGDAYYERRPARWWEFRKLSSRSDGNTERIYERK